MILLNKKRILFITSIILCSIISCDFANKNLIKSEQVSSTPVSSHVVILDAGHGNPDGGATNSNGEIIESDLNLQITLKLQNLLESANCTVILTRSDENGIYESDANSIREKKISDMKNRVKIANDSEADILVSIHMNKLQDKSVKGFQVFYSTTYPTSKKIAQNIQEILNNSITEFENTKRIKQIPDIYLSKHLNLPFILIECGFLSNEFETNLLTNEEYQDKLAYGIYKGILNSLE